MEKQIVKNSAGIDIALIVHRPEQDENRLAILCPGYLDTKDYQHLVELAKVLTALGFTVVRFDPVGTWDSGGSIEDYTMANYQDAIKSVKEHFTNQKPYTFILVAGHSRGGRMSVIYGSNDEDVSAVVGIMPSAESKPREDSSLDDEKPKRSVRDLPNEKSKQREYLVPHASIVESYDYSAIKSAPDVKAPLLLIAGELDELISVDEVKAIYNPAPEPKELVIAKGIGHDYRHNPDEVKEINGIITNWLQKFI